MKSHMAGDSHLHAIRACSTFLIPQLCVKNHRLSFPSQFRHIDELSPSEEINKCHIVITVHSMQTVVAVPFMVFSGEQLSGHNLEDQ